MTSVFFQYLDLPGVVDVKMKAVWDSLDVVVASVGICVVVNEHGYVHLSMVPFFSHTAMMQFPSPSVVL